MPRGSNLGVLQKDIPIWSTVTLVGFGVFPLFSSCTEKKNAMFRFFTFTSIATFSSISSFRVVGKSGSINGKQLKGYSGNIVCSNEKQ